MDEFGKVAVGEIQRQYLVELKDKIKHKYNQFRNENEKQAEVSQTNQIRRRLWVLGSLSRYQCFLTDP